MGRGNNLAGAGKVFNSLVESLDGLRVPTHLTDAGLR